MTGGEQVAVIIFCLFLCFLSWFLVSLVWSPRPDATPLRKLRTTPSQRKKISLTDFLRPKKKCWVGKKMGDYLAYNALQVVFQHDFHGKRVANYQRYFRMYFEENCSHKDIMSLRRESTCDGLFEVLHHVSAHLLSKFGMQQNETCAERRPKGRRCTVTHRRHRSMPSLTRRRRRG